MGFDLWIHCTKGQGSRYPPALGVVAGVGSATRQWPTDERKRPEQTDGVLSDLVEYPIVTSSDTAVGGALRLTST